MNREKGTAASRREIALFLKSRRSAIKPESVGLPPGLRRRTPGLRREELATLAGVGITWYTWLEQGRDIQVSSRVLERVSRALQLTASDAAYLFALAGRGREEFGSGSDESVDDAVQDVLNGFQSGPAFLVSEHWDVLAFNPLADLVFDFSHQSSPFGRNHIWRFFMDPSRRARYQNWEEIAEGSVGWIRAVHGKTPDDPYLNKLISALCNGSEVFKRHWEAQLTSPARGTISFGMNLPRMGTAQFTSVRFRALDSQRNLILLTPRDARTAALMRKLATGTARRKSARTPA